jgi:hypothetical protein
MGITPGVVAAEREERGAEATGIAASYGDGKKYVAWKIRPGG